MPSLRRPRLLESVLVATAVACCALATTTILGTSASNADPIDDVLNVLLGPEGCPTASASPSASASPAASAVPSPSASASASPAACPSASPSATPSASATIGSPTPSTSPVVSSSPGASASALPSESPSVAPSPSEPSVGDFYDAPVLRQSHTSTSATFVFSVDPSFTGGTVYFFRRSGQTGKVAPLGTATVDQNGQAIRTLNGLKKGQIIRAYGKIMDAYMIDSPYSNDVAFKTG